MSLILKVSPSPSPSRNFRYNRKMKVPQPIALCTGNDSQFTANESPSVRSDCLLQEVVSLVQEVIAHFPGMIALLALALLEQIGCSTGSGSP